MLKEIVPVRQENDSHRRRWFEDDDFDLIVWYEPDGGLHGFQLCYNKNRDEHAFTWRRDRGYSHHRVDVGEELAGENRTPTLNSAGTFPCAEIRARFAECDAQIDPEIARLVRERLDDYSRQTGGNGISQQDGASRPSTDVPLVKPSETTPDSKLE
ncbi:MAG: hypothetical protein HY360_08560 [Verrucomicrobia bacterium]|nr:hypothetical protein [Verrucomicrobiota bacterium]